ncbi:hypothetical protein AB1L07_18915 [Niallia alba]|uniref:Uncharacterized protein n=1 Tax=Niallia circulans TaxID=1397 RepID=A0A941GH02_NIACI|nr:MULTISPECIES: hypothetical protein [Niallia]MCB5240021.1 hypothetical protein [Niallia circulans]MED3795481.1 hypothetical protein [Niallia alba]
MNLEIETKTDLIIEAIEYYLSLDTLQEEYARKGIRNALINIKKIEQKENQKRGM